MEWEVQMSGYITIVNVYAKLTTDTHDYPNCTMR